MQGQVRQRFSNHGGEFESMPREARPHQHAGKPGVSVDDEVVIGGEGVKTDAVPGRFQSRTGNVPAEKTADFLQVRGML